MFFRSSILYLFLCGIIALTGWKAYQYFFDHSCPEIALLGIEEGATYAGDIRCLVEGSDAYQVAHLSIWLDGKPVINKFKINKQKFEYAVPIATKGLPQGKHALKITAQDSSFRQNRTDLEYTFLVDNDPLQAAFVKSSTDLKVFQGRVLHLQFQTNKPIKEATVKTLSHEFPCVPEAPRSLIYECFIPVSCEEVPNEYIFGINIEDHAGNTAVLNGKFQIVMYPFKKQNLNLNKELIKAENEQWPTQKLFEDKLIELSSKSPRAKLWHGAFYLPIDSRGVSTDFGTVRTTQERGKYAHNAVDLLGAPRSTVWAPQDGIIVLKDRYACSGNTVVIDHGCGIFSLLFHLDSFANITVGDSIKKGSPVGTLGKTGYASGYHLHWEMRVNNIAVDPLQWSKLDF